MTARKIREIVWTDDNDNKMLELQRLGESVQQAISLRDAHGIAICILESDRAGELSGLLSWLLTHKLGNHIFEQEDIVPMVVRVPALKDALLPILPELLNKFVYNNETADCFLSSAHAFADSKDPDYAAVALPLFPEALKRASWATPNFGNLACSFLDMGGNPDVLVEPVRSILASIEDDPQGRFMPEKKEAKLAKHLCSDGFIRLLNHPRAHESHALKQLLYPYSGHVVYDIAPWRMFPTHFYVLACVQGNKTGLAWGPSDEHQRYTPVNFLRPLKIDFLNCARPEEVAEIAIGLFEQMKRVPRRDIRSLAHNAVKKLKAEFGGAIRGLVEEREWWANESLEECRLG